MADKNVWKRVRAAAVLGVTWAVAWSPLGLLIGAILGGNRTVPDDFPLDDWLVPTAMAGFVGGAIFSGILRRLAGRRTFDQLSSSRFAAWGAAGGLLLGGLAIAKWSLDLGYGPIIWPRALIIVGATTLMSAASAAGSLALARRADGDTLSPGETPTLLDEPE